MPQNDPTAAVRSAFIGELIAEGMLEREDGTLMLPDHEGYMVEITVHDVRDAEPAPKRPVHLTTPARAPWDEPEVTPMGDQD